MLPVNFLLRLSLIWTKKPTDHVDQAAKLSEKNPSPFICLLANSRYLTRGGLTSVGRQRWGSATHCSFIRA